MQTPHHFTGTIDVKDIDSRKTGVTSPKTMRNRTNKCFSFGRNKILLTWLCICFPFYLFSYTNKTKDAIEHERIIKLLESYYYYMDNNMYSGLNEIFTSPVYRFFTDYNLDIHEIIEKAKDYDQKFKVISKKTSIRHNTITVKKGINDNYLVEYIIDYNLTRKEKNKPSQFVLNLTVDLNRDYKIQGIYENILSKSGGIQQTAQDHTYTEKDTIDEVFDRLYLKVPEISKMMRKNGYKAVMLSDPTEEEPYYTIWIAEDMGTHFNSICWFLIYMPNFKITVIEGPSGNEMTLKEWRQKRAELRRRKR